MKLLPLAYFTRAKGGKQGCPPFGNPPGEGGKKSGGGEGEAPLVATTHATWRGTAKPARRRGKRAPASVRNCINKSGKIYKKNKISKKKKTRKTKNSQQIKREKNIVI